MSQSVYHGILIKDSFKDPDFISSFHLFNQKTSDNWTIVGVEVLSQTITKRIKEIQDNFRIDEHFYGHFYNEEELIVIFKDAVFFVNPHKSSWYEVIEYGKSLGIPEEQLDFRPNRFQDEKDYFKQ